MYIFYTFTDAEEVKRSLSHELLGIALVQWIKESGCELDAGEVLKSFHQEANGKPYFRAEGAPQFSISHSKNAWAVMIGESACGLDIQYSVPAKYDAIARKCYSEVDAQKVHEAPADEKAAVFYRIWTMREALVKAEGATVFSNPDDLGVPGKWDVREVLLPGGIFAAAAVEADEEIIIRELQEA